MVGDLVRASFAIRWLPIRRRLKVWTIARCFEAPKSVFAPDDTFAEEVFAKMARREMPERKWELTPEQKRWLQKLGHTLEVVEISTKDVTQKVREARPAIAQDTAADKAPIDPSVTGESQQAGVDHPTESSDGPQTSGVSRTDSKTAPLQGIRAEDVSEGQEEEAEPASAEKRDERGGEGENAYALKSPEMEAEFVHVTAHTRNRPRGEHKPTQVRQRHLQEQHPLTEVSQATKAEIEETAVRLKTNRPKDRQRLAMLAGKAAIDQARLSDILARHHLDAAWKTLNPPP